MKIFETFPDNFELTVDTIVNKNQFLIVVLGDFNAKKPNWYKNDISSYEKLIPLRPNLAYNNQ